MRPRDLRAILLVALAATSVGGACLALTGNVPLTLLQAAGWGCMVALATGPRLQGASWGRPSNPDDVQVPA